MCPSDFSTDSLGLSEQQVNLWWVAILFFVPFPLAVVFGMVEYPFFLQQESHYGNLETHSKNEGNVDMDGTQIGCN